SIGGELFFTTAYLRNRFPHSALGGHPPYFKMRDKPADISGLRIIGTRGFVHTETSTQTLDDKTSKRSIL
ncbi:unnamed protein product, partial [Hapterophycus canaliculatus]